MPIINYGHDGCKVLYNYVRVFDCLLDAVLQQWMGYITAFS